MKKVFIVGIHGGVGRRVAMQLHARGVEVDGLVRQSRQAEELATRGIATQQGDLVAMSVEELAAALAGRDAIVFSAGASGGGLDMTTRIDGEGPGKLAEAARLAGVKRFLLVSVFPEAWRERNLGRGFDHYILEKKKAEARLVLTDLDWIILRPSALKDDPGTGRVDLGLAKLHEDITRDDVAATAVELLARPDTARMILEVTGGSTPIKQAVEALDARKGASAAQPFADLGHPRT